MSKDTNTGRDFFRLIYFLGELVDQERLTIAERDRVREASREIARSAGYLDANNNPAGGDDDAYHAVTRHKIQAMKQKLLELHPELGEELERYINHRPFHPLPPVAGRFAKSGVALDQYQTLARYIEAKRDEGVISVPESHMMWEPALRVIEDSGLDQDELNSQTDKAVLARAYHLMKQKLLQLHPELADDVRNLGSSRSP